MKGWNANQKMLARILGAAALYGAAIIIEKTVPGQVGFWVSLPLFLGAYFLVGWNVLWEAIYNIAHGEVFDENFLMSIATIGAFALGEYPEAVAVMLFYQVGELFQSYALQQSRKSIADMMTIAPEFANKLVGEAVEVVDPEDVKVGDLLLVRPGEKVPVDGIVLEGSSSLDTAALTGESVPRDVGPGEEIISGCVNQKGTLKIRVTKEYADSTVTKILELVENASARKAPAEKFITKFARVYTPAVVFAALAVAILPPLILQQSFSTWIYRGLTFLVISCPCALVISIPLGFFGGIGGASKQGILVKGGNYLELLSMTHTVLFDKTGTLTKGAFQVVEILPAEGWSQEALLEMAAHGEAHSTHPIALSITKAYGKSTQESRITHLEEIPGHCLYASIDGREVLVGNAKWMKEKKIPYPQTEQEGTCVYVAVDEKYAGLIRIADELKPDAREAIAQLRAAGVSRMVMLTGDNEVIGKKVASDLGLDDFKAGLLPQDKVKEIEKELENKSRKQKVVFVGDGMNDAPVLARADVGIAMGGLGSDAAIEAADVVIMTDEPSKIAKAIRISRKTMGIVRENIVFALGVKALVLILSVFGLASMWAAVFADVGVAVLAILNSVRALHTK